MAIRIFLVMLLLASCGSTCDAEEGQGCLSLCDAGPGTFPRPGKTTRSITWAKSGKRKEPLLVPTLAIRFANQWEPGQTLYISFVDGYDEPQLLEKVKSYSREWEKYINLRLRFLDKGVTAPGANGTQVRITFKDKGSHHSLIGTDGERDQSQPSMNLGISSLTADEEVQRVVLHEFGHALGFIHEHQSPMSRIKWKQPEAMNYYKKGGWSEEMVKLNVFKRADPQQFDATKFDRESIMLYPIPPGITTDGFSQGWNRKLSKIDILGAGSVYPAESCDKLRALVRVAPGYVSDKGVMVSAVRAGSPLGKLRMLGSDKASTLEEGDIIYQIKGQEVNDCLELENVASSLKGTFRIKILNVSSGEVEDCVGRIPD